MKLLVFLAVIFFNLSAFCLGRDKITVAYIVYPPFVMATDDLKHPRGVIVDFWNQLAQESNFEIEWVGPLSYPRGLKQVIAGELDAVVSVPVDMAVKQGFVFNPKILLSAQQALIVLKDTAVEEPLVAAKLKGKVITKMSGGRTPPFLKDTDIRWEEIGSEDDPISRSLQMLLAGRVWGVVVASEDSAFYYASMIGKLDQIKAVPLPGEILDTTIGLSPKLKSSITKRILEAGDKNIAARFDFKKHIANYLKDAGKDHVPATKLK